GRFVTSRTVGGEKLGGSFAPIEAFLGARAADKECQYDAAHETCPAGALSFWIHPFTHPHRAHLARRRNTLVAYYFTIVTCVRTDGGIAFCSIAGARQL